MSTSTSTQPVLSGPPPDPVGHEHACRNCKKEFNILFLQGRRCHHCGCSYCSTCAGKTALMLRGNRPHSVPVCDFCFGNLKITASSRDDLLLLHGRELVSYANAYNLHINDCEKEAVVDRLISYRRGGCLPPENEDFYRKYSVPNPPTPRRRGIFGFTRQATPAPPPLPRSRSPPQRHFPRPDVESQWQPPPPLTSRPTSMPQTPTRPRMTSRDVTPQSQPPPLDRLLSMAPEDILSLPVRVLKEILFQNHVDSSLLIEKSDLVGKVTALIADERRERERQGLFRQMEQEQERLRRMETSQPERIGGNRSRIQADIQDCDHETEAETQLDEFHLDSEHQTLRMVPEETTEMGLGRDPEVVGSNDASQQISTVPQPISGLNKRPPVTADLERNSLCVICQDEEANIAIVDCGHMAMCRVCSELIMNSTRECPLCRTRIVTEARLLRIFKP